MIAETLVVDCSVAAAWLLPEALRPQARRLVELVNAGELSLIAPDLILAEFASLIAKRARRKEISIPAARDVFNQMQRSVLHLFDTPPLLGPALELALRHHLSLWDCVYLALAAQQNCSVITADQRLFRDHSPRHPAIQLLS